jgi:flagellar motor switch protein FliN/FliY
MKPTLNVDLGMLNGKPFIQNSAFFIEFLREEFVTENQTTSSTKKFELNMDSLLDVSVEISVEIGRTKMSIGELLALSKGSIVELNRLAGESVDVYVNEKLLGKGEIVVVNERLGVRVTEIVTPKEIVQKLG